MKKLFEGVTRRTIALSLALLMLLSTFVVYANSGSSADNGNPSGRNLSNASVGFHGAFAYRIGLSRCDNGDGISITDIASTEGKALAVQQYASHYYMECLGPTVYVPFADNTETPVATVSYNGQPCTPATPGSALYDVLEAIATGRESRYLVTSADGARHIPPDEAIVSELMGELRDLGGNNVDLYNKWLEESTSLDSAKHAVVVCIEIVGDVTGDGSAYWMSAADIADRWGGFKSQFLTTDISGYYDGRCSTTFNALGAITGWAAGGTDSWPNRATKRFFCARHNEIGGINSFPNHDAYSNVAANAWQTLSNGGSEGGINGCTVVAVGAGGGEISGRYTWHIDANGLPPNSLNYREDNIGPGDAEKLIGVGAIDIKQTNVVQWADWIASHEQEGNFTIHMEKYYIAGSNFSLVYDDVLNERQGDVNHLTSAADFNDEDVSGSDLYRMIREGSDLDINGIRTGGRDILGGSPIGEDRYQVAYATTVDIIAHNGDTVHLINNDVHYAIYGSDNDRTYKFNQILDDGAAQVKEGGLDMEEYEAMSGVPTTSNLFITQGGEQNIVQLQYRYVDDTYVRKYNIHSSREYPNYMYYDIGDSTGDNVITKEGSTEDGASESSVKNEAWAECVTGVKGYFENFEQHDNWNGDNTVPYKPEMVGYTSVPDWTELLNYVHNLPGTAPSNWNGYTKTVVMASVEDLDSDATEDVTLTLTISGWSPGTKDHRHGDGCTQLATGWTCNDSPDNHFKYGLTWSVSIDYGDWSKDIKMLSFDETLEQVYEHVRYMDIVEAKVWRLAGGKHTGLKPILATPTDEIIDMAVEQMGYALYDSEQVSERVWDELDGRWVAGPDPNNDLEETGRALNSYSVETLNILNTLPEWMQQGVTCVEDSDIVSIEYDIASSGGRSHNALDSYKATLAAYVFYDESHEPYRNTLSIASDVLAVNTGNSATSGWEVFCGNDVVTDGVTGITGLEQYIMSEDSEFKEFRHDSLGFGMHRADKEVRVSEISEAAFSESVDLNILDNAGSPYATKYNQDYIVFENEKSFVDTIPDIGGITWVGYRGNCLTSSVSHEPDLRGITPGFDPMNMNALNDGYEFYGKTFSAGEKMIDDSLAAPQSEFPMTDGLNTNRTQSDGLYQTGYANVYYERVIAIDHTAGSGVLPLVPVYNGANIRSQGVGIDVPSPQASVRATYTDSWETPNDIVVFNPSTTESAMTYRVSTYMPDVVDAGGEDDTHPIRDQRASGYMVGNAKDGVFGESASSVPPVIEEPTRTTKRMKEPGSSVSTSYYRWDRDYNVISDTDESTAFISQGSSFIAPCDGIYKFSVFYEQEDPDASPLSTSVRVRLNEGDKVFEKDGILYKESRSAVVTFNDYINTTNVSSYVDNTYIVTPSRVDSFILSELADISAGEVIHLHYEFEDSVNVSTFPTPSFNLEQFNAYLDELISREECTKDFYRYGDVNEVYDAWGNLVDLYACQNILSTMSIFDVNGDPVPFSNLVSTSRLAREIRTVTGAPGYSLDTDDLFERIAGYPYTTPPASVSGEPYESPYVGLSTEYPEVTALLDIITAYKTAVDGYDEDQRLGLYTVAEQMGTPFDVNVIVDDSGAVASKNIVQTSVDGTSWDVYIEFRNNCRVRRIDVDFNWFAKLREPVYSDTYMLEYTDVFLMSKGSAYSDPPSALTTWEAIDGLPVCAYNELWVDLDSNVFSPATIEYNRYYVSFTSHTIGYTILADSANNPHKVYNANWKYYVVGWLTRNGSTIASPTDPLLNRDDTVLMWPSGLGSITVGELRNNVYLVMYNGDLYVTTKEAGLQHKIMEKGWEVVRYDTFTMGNQSELDDLTKWIAEDTTNTYPLDNGRTGNVFQDAYYEFFFKLSDGTGADHILYDVQYSKNAEHKYHYNDTRKVNNEDAWKIDWEEVSYPVVSNWAGAVRKDYDTEAEYLSLDDKFTIHFDNFGNFAETNWHNEESTNVDLGLGYTSPMDTITWIKEKYVVFPFDVYTFGFNSYGPDPSVTYTEYESGSINDSSHVVTPELGLTYIPRGTKIDLGHYEGDSGEADNLGHYIDYGANCNYNYDFWVVLTSDEIKQGDIRFVSININNHNGETNMEASNKDAPSAVYGRHANAVKHYPMSIVGRIGNLTMLDTGDYRFSDTFKTVSDTAQWLVYGLIKKLSPYTNVFNNPSTQKALLLDPWDVRGRLGIKSLADAGTYGDYTTYHTEGYNTYNTQWHKSGAQTRIASLPLTSEFNDHTALKLTQQRIGYPNLLTLDSIGNYYGSSQYYSDEEGLEPSNVNHDYNNQKVQVRPYYIAINTSTLESFPVDVYMKTDTGYECINTASSSISDSLNNFYRNGFLAYLEGNTEDEDPANGTYGLDQNMLRRMVTSAEAQITWTVMNHWNNDSNPFGASSYSMLTNVKNYDADKAWDVENRYYYGNGQYLFLRDRNRTFVGANSIALNYDESEATSYVEYKQHAQKWYFDLGLPSSAVFIRTGQPFKLENIVSSEEIVILSCVDIYAIGQTWNLHYKSPVSIQEIEVNGRRIPPQTWNPIRDKEPWLIPVTIYDSYTSSQDDLDTKGTH